MGEIEYCTTRLSACQAIIDDYVTNTDANDRKARPDGKEQCYFADPTWDRALNCNRDIWHVEAKVPSVFGGEMVVTVVSVEVAMGLSRYSAQYGLEPDIVPVESGAT